MRIFQERSRVDADIVEAALLQPLMTLAREVALKLRPDLAETVLFE